MATQVFAVVLALPLALARNAARASFGHRPLLFANVFAPRRRAAGAKVGRGAKPAVPGLALPVRVVATLGVRASRRMRARMLLGGHFCSQRLLRFPTLLFPSHTKKNPTARPLKAHVDL